MLSFTFVKTKLFAKNFSNLDDSGIPLPIFLFRTNLKLLIPVTPKMVKKVTKNFDSSRASGPDFIPVVVLKNFEPPKLLYILAEIFSLWLKESCFPDCWKLSLVVPVFKNV